MLAIPKTKDGKTFDDILREGLDGFKPKPKLKKKGIRLVSKPSKNYKETDIIKK